MIDLYGVLQEQETINGELGLGVDYYKGEKGDTPIKGVDYLTPDDVKEISDKVLEQVEAGTKGEDGKSAYQIALDEGFEGSEAEWLASLKGADGEPDVYIKDASVSGNTLTLTKKDDTEVVFTPSGGSGGGSYTLPVADMGTLGGIKLGNTNQLTIQDNLGSYGASLHAGINKADVPIIPYANDTIPGVIKVRDSGSGLKYSNGTIFMSPASTTTYGTVAYDGKTIQAKLNRSDQPTLYVATATTSSLGVIKPDGTTTTVDSQGNLKANIDNDTIIVKDGLMCVDKSQLSASNGLPIGGDYPQILMKNGSSNFDSTWVGMSEALGYAGISIGSGSGSDWQYTQDQYNSDLYNIKEMVISVQDSNGNNQMGYFNFGNSNLGSGYQSQTFYFDYNTSSPSFLYDGTYIALNNYNNLDFIAYKT